MAGCCAWSPLARGWLSYGRRSTHTLLEELLRAWPPLGRGWLSCSRRKYTRSLLQELVRAWPRLAVVWQAQFTEPPAGAAARVAAAGPQLASCGRQYTERPGGAAARGRRWPAAGSRVAGAVHRASWKSCCARPPLGRGWLSCGRRSTQSLLEELVHAWPPLARVLCVNVVRGSHDRRRCEEHRNCHLILHHIRHKSHIRYARISHTHLSHTIFHTPLCHTPSFTQLFHTPSFTHNVVKHHLSHTIYDTTSLTHTIFHTPSQTIFHTPLCHTPSLTHHLSHTTLSHTIFHHTIFHHTIFHTHTTLSHTIFPPPPPLSFLPSPSPLQHFLLITGRS